MPGSQCAEVPAGRDRFIHLAAAAQKIHLQIQQAGTARIRPQPFFHKAQQFRCVQAVVLQANQTEENLSGKIRRIFPAADRQKRLIVFQRRLAAPFVVRKLPLAELHNRPGHLGFFQLGQQLFGVLPLVGQQQDPALV